jgi:hypothetical protein
LISSAMVTTLSNPLYAKYTTVTARTLYDMKGYRLLGSRG